MASGGLQPQPEGETRLDSSMRVSPERLAEFDRLIASDGITAVMRALEREREERARVAGPSVINTA